ncbi:hypothetical protein EON67_07065, partial [archaeon]
LYQHGDGGSNRAVAAAAAAGASAGDDVDMRSAAADEGEARGEGGPLAPHMVIDGHSLLNLELLENTYDGSRKGTIIGVLDTCATPFGKRRFQQWLCAPLLRARDIEDRLAAVDDLIPLLDSVVADARRVMKGLPDLERLLARVHALGSRFLASNHPDSRAVMYETDTYSKRKIGDLLTVLRAFDAVSRVRAVFHAGGAADASAPLAAGIKSPLLHRVLHTQFPDLTQPLQFFSAAFDAHKVRFTSGRASANAAFDARTQQLTSCVRTCVLCRVPCRQRRRTASPPPPAWMQRTTAR